VIIPREEGKLVMEQKRLKKTKSPYKLPMHKSNRALRTYQLNMQDNNTGFTESCHYRFDNIKNLVLSRKPNPKPLLVNPSSKNPKHFAVLTESGIVYDSPLNPIEIATRRADRIAKDKKMQQAMVQAQAVQAAQAQVQGANAEQLVATQQRQLAAVVAGSPAAKVATTQVAANSTVATGNYALVLIDITLLIE